MQYGSTTGGPVRSHLFDDDDDDAVMNSAGKSSVGKSAGTGTSLQSSKELLASILWHPAVSSEETGGVKNRGPA